jgi:PEP-CTERM/exosortase A-associated glycosyltransferase
MRILHVLDHSLPLHSGYAFRTLAILRQQRALGWETLHLTSPKHGDSQAAEEEIDGWHFYRTTAAASPFAVTPVVKELVVMARIFRRMEEIVRRHRPDVIHAHSPVLNAIPALRVGRRFHIPVVYEVRALWEDAAVDHGTARQGGLRYRLSRAAETYALRSANAVTTICEGLRQEIIGRGVATDRVTVIPNAVDVDAFKFGKAPDEALRAQLGLAGTVLVGFVGSFFAYEGLDLLLGALPLILAERPEVRVLLVGGGPHEAQLKDMARRLGVADKVVFAGRVAHSEVHRYYSLIDVLAYPRRSMRLTELVTPLKPLEAMAQGHLLVASDVGGHRELIRDGETGTLFPAGRSDALADAVLRLLRQSDWSARRLRARRFVEAERNWRSSVERYRGVYADLAQEAS